MAACTCVRTDTYDTDELRQRHLDGDGHLLALVHSRPDQFVVTLRTQQVVHQALFGVLRPAACGGTGGWWWWGGEGGLGVTSDIGAFARARLNRLHVSMPRSCLHDGDGCRSNVCCL